MNTRDLKERTLWLGLSASCFMLCTQGAFAYQKMDCDITVKKIHYNECNVGENIGPDNKGPVAFENNSDGSVTIKNTGNGNHPLPYDPSDPSVDLSDLLVAYSDTISGGSCTPDTVVSQPDGDYSPIQPGKSRNVTLTNNTSTMGCYLAVKLAAPWLRFAPYIPQGAEILPGVRMDQGNAPLIIKQGGAAAQGRSRTFTIVNNGPENAVGQISISDGEDWLSGTVVTPDPSTCTNLAVGAAPCEITVTPPTDGAVSKDVNGVNCTEAKAPTKPSLIELQYDNSDEVSVPFVVVSYGCEIEPGNPDPDVTGNGAGLIFAMYDDTDAGGDVVANASIGGKLVTLRNQAWRYGAVNLGEEWSLPGDYGTPVDPWIVWGVDETSTQNIPSPNLNQLSGQIACFGATDGRCNTKNIDLWANLTSLPSGTASSPMTEVCEGISNNLPANQHWYVPSICELGNSSAYEDKDPYYATFKACNNEGDPPTKLDYVASAIDASDTSNYMDVDDNIWKRLHVQLLTDAPTGGGGDLLDCEADGTDRPALTSRCLFGDYWSSAEYVSSPQNSAWTQIFSKGDSYQYPNYNKISHGGVRCVRAFNP